MITCREMPFDCNPVGRTVLCMCSCDRSSNVWDCNASVLHSYIDFLSVTISALVRSRRPMNGPTHHPAHRSGAAHAIGRRTPILPKPNASADDSWEEIVTPQPTLDGARVTEHASAKSRANQQAFLSLSSGIKAAFEACGWRAGGHTSPFKAATPIQHKGETFVMVEPAAGCARHILDMLMWKDARVSTRALCAGMYIIILLHSLPTGWWWLHTRDGAGCQRGDEVAHDVGK